MSGVSVTKGAEDAVPTGGDLVVLSNVNKHFGALHVLQDIDLTIARGEVVVVIGPSGSGKSTLLRILSGLTPPSSGTVLWHGEPVGTSSPHVAIVFQSFALFPWLTVVENVEVPLLARGLMRAERRSRALRTLESVGLKGFENAYPKELSEFLITFSGTPRGLSCTLR